MRLEAFTETDLAGLKELQPPDWSDITHFYRLYLDLPYCHAVKVLSDGKLVGAGVSICHADTAWLALIVVHPEYRRRGIGQFITIGLIEAIDRTRYKTIYLMATPMGEPVYLKLGFIPETEQLFFKSVKQGFTKQIPPEIAPLQQDDYEALFRMDREIAGEYRSEYMRSYLGSGWSYKRNAELIGFFLPEMGEGMIMAKDEAAGLALMALRLQQQHVAVVAVDNVQATGYLKMQGFEVFRKATRMFLGEARVWQPRQIYNRVSGQLG